MGDEAREIVLLFMSFHGARGVPSAYFFFPLLLADAPLWSGHQKDIDFMDKKRRG